MAHLNTSSLSRAEKGCTEGHSLPSVNDWKGKTASELKMQKIGQWIVAWGDGHLSTKTYWETMRNRIGGLSDSILKIAKVAQPNGDRRFDLIVMKEDAVKILHAIKDKLPHIRAVLHRPYSDRTRVERHGIAVAAAWCRLVSFNVNGMNNKRESLLVWAQQDQVDVLCIQEHLRSESDWVVRLPGFQCFSAPAGEKIGSRGVAVLVRNGIPAFERVVSDYLVLVEILIGATKVLVGSVYLPTTKKFQTKVMKDISYVLATEGKKIQRIALLGDFNIDRDKIAQKCSAANLSLGLLDVEGDPNTWHRCPTKKSTAIDHVLASESLKELCSKVQVLREWDFSDHFPIRVDLDVPRQDSKPQQQQKRRRITVATMEKEKMKIRQSNRYAVLLEDLGGAAELTKEKLENLAHGFISNTHALAEELMGKAHEAGRHKHIVSEHTKRLILRRSELFGELSEAVRARQRKPTEKRMRREEEAKKRYIAAKEEAFVAATRARLQDFDKHVGQAVDMCSKHDSRGIFRWCKTLINGRKGQTSSPVHNTNGELVLDPDGILKVWKQHFAGLAEEGTGHSKSREHWEQLFPPSEDEPELPLLNDDVTWGECVAVIRSMAKGKAPGENGIPVEWLALAVGSKKVVHPTTAPDTALGKVILALVKGMLGGAYIPECIRSSVLVPIPKKGDLTDVNNYRGISLMDSLLKVTCTLVNRRLVAALEGAQRLCREQAGFRQAEEGIAQVVSLFEICERRREEGNPTYLGFVDFSKAYDTVPHEGVLRKMCRMGIKGRLLEFLRALLYSSTFRVRLPCGVSEAVELRRGLPQGNPISCVAFDVFINDSLDGCQSSACQVPGVDEKIKGLMFADDIVVLAASKGQLQKSLTVLSKWAARNEMTFGIKKCGAMVCNGDVQSLHTGNKVLLGNEEIPIVDKYTYLGVSVYPDLTLKKIVEDRTKKVMNALGGLRPFLMASRVPVHIRLLILRACLVPVATFGGELLGFDQALVKPIQKVIDRSLRLVIGIKEQSNTMCPMAVIYRECNVAPIFAVMSAMRLRAKIKFPSLRTWISLLHQQRPVKKRKNSKTWIYKTQNYMASNGKEVAILPAKFQKGAMLKHLWVRGEKRKQVTRTVAWTKYQAWRGSVDYLSFHVRDPEVIRGMMQVALLRTGALWTGIRAAYAKLIPAKFKNECPCCKKKTYESLRHMLIHCRSWKKERAKMLNTIKKAFAKSKIANPLEGKGERHSVILLLGGEVDGCTLSPFWDKGFTPSTVDDVKIAKLKRTPLCVYVARFLARIKSAHASALWMNYHNKPVESQSHQGTAAMSTQDRGPDGGFD